MELLWRDLRVSLRSWRRAPAAIAVAVLALTLAIAAVTAVFSLVSGVLVRPLPYATPDRLVMLWQDMRAQGGPERDWISPGLFVEWQRRASMFEHVAVIRGWQPTLTGEEPERLRGAAVSHGYFAALGVPPASGRFFSPDDDRPGAAPVVVISHALWTRRFGANAAVLETPVVLDGQPATVIGVMPASFLPPIIDAEIWTPTAINPARAPRGMVVLRAMALLRPGVSLEQARAGMGAIAAQLATEDPEWERARTLVVPLHEDMVGNVRLMLLVLVATVGLVIVIACANLANLLLARASERVRDITVRTALGAGRRHILSQALAESLMLAIVAGTGGAVLGWWALRGLLAIAPPSAPRLQEVHVDGWVLLATALVALASTMLAGLAPAAAAARLDISGSLRDGGRESTTSSWLRSSLVVLEVAVAVVLIAGAGLLTRSLVAMQRVDLGFEPEGVLSAAIQPPRNAYRSEEALRQLYTAILERTSALPHVESAAMVSMLPLSGGEMRINFGIPGRPAPVTREDDPIAAMRWISAGYFQTLGIRLVSGRVPAASDTADSAPVVVVNQALARRYWPGDDALGRKVDVEMREATIVGIVADIRHAGPAVPPGAEMYLPYTQFPPRGGWLVVRASGDPALLAPALRTAVWQVDRNLPLSSVSPMSRLVERNVAQPRFMAALLGGFALLALVLTLGGVYSVLSFACSRRTREIGVRMALGAERAAVMWMVLRQSLLLVMAGLAVGTALALPLSRVLRALLFGVGPADPATFGAMALLIVIAGLAASYIPARRAALVDPVVALREE